jgi:hypothetical protein
MMRLATFAGAEPFRLGEFRDGKEDYLLSRRLAAGARRAAVDAGGTDGINEYTVKVGVSVLDRMPLGFFGEVKVIDLVLQHSSH